MKKGFDEVEKFRYLILAVQRHGNRLLNEALKEVGVTASQAEVIRVLEMKQPLSLKDLGQLLICETGSPSRLVERMIRDGHVAKMTHPDDSRFVLLQLTKQGKEAAEKVKFVEEQLYHHMQEMASEAELSEVNPILERFLRGSALHETMGLRGFL
ncbi:DNA-binding MarR family transcriptional regulator [Paenibacillus taihuensis]|uniref:DNA-binding MarR family transcriptional regulator n=1 Tax=Paenibacillus taihuensis TaxID=1156355 RepID=A0A3D9RQB7_9BACL|nr:winged helix DNA-binding protein [Paenibacillus taihuensis]REE78645.1 DNA-binding MarR family transcriptional regulator [Paenibacillus taihuensis]